MAFMMTDLTWQGAGYTLPAALPGRLLDALLSAGLAKDSAQGFESRANEWIALRPWTLAGRVSLEHVSAERVFLCASGVRGSGEIRVGGKAAARFPSGDWEIEITAQAIGQMAADIALVFNPQSPQGQPPQARVGVDGGLWLRGVTQLQICEFHARPHVSGGYGTVTARAVVLPYVPGRYTFRYAAVWGEETLGVEEKTENLYAVQTTLTHELVLPVPRAWRPGGPNKPVLLRLTVSRGGRVCDDRLLKTGFSDAVLALSPAPALSMDGKPVFLAAADWTDCTAALLTTEEIDRRLAKLQNAHINCVRVDGFAPDAFYNALDRVGMFLWQTLPSDEAEALCVIRRVRHRPFLLAYAAQARDKARLSALVASGDAAHPLVSMESTPQSAALTGFPGPEALFHRMNGDEAPIRAVACPAPPLRPEAMASGEPYWPPATPLWTHRAHSTSDLSSLEGWLDAGLQEPHFAIRLLRFLQAETLRYAVERARMRAQEAAGVLVDCPYEKLPSLYSPALLDGDTARPAYWALESALRPVHACARLSRMGYPYGAAFEARLCLLCDETVPGPLTVRAKLYRPDGSVLAEAHDDTAPGTKELGILRAKLPDEPCALVLRVTAERLGQVLDVNDYTICVAMHALLWPLARLPLATVRGDGKGSLVNEGSQAALGVHFGPDSEGVFPGWGALLPGERRAIRQENAIEGLNFEPLEKT